MNSGAVCSLARKELQMNFDILVLDDPIRYSLIHAIQTLRVDPKAAAR